MSSKSLIVLVASVLAGERDAEPLRRQAQAMGDVFDLLTEMWAADDLHPYDPWQASTGEQQRRAHIWAAYVRLQSALQFMEADNRANRLTWGHLPRVSYDQVGAFLSQVAQHRSAAMQLAANPGGNVGAPPEVIFSDWAHVEPCPPEHLAAMVAVARDMLERAEAVMATLIHLDDRREIRQFQQLFASAQADTSLALRRYEPIAGMRRVDSEEHEAIEESIRSAFATLYRLGLCLAMPSLLTVKAGRQPKERRILGPGQRGFDPWCLTALVADQDPRTSRRNPEAQEAIRDLWRVDPNPAATLRIHTQIVEAIADRQVEDTGRYYYCCPWSPIYRARTNVVINGMRILAGQTFTFDVSGEELAEGGAFVRRIVVANFDPTNKVDYCSPDGGGHHD